MNWSYLLVFLPSMSMEAIIIGAYWYFIKKQNPLKILGLVFMLNACTHPTVIFILMKTGVYLYSILIAEGFAWLFEAFIYQKKITQGHVKEALMISFVANFISWQMGPWTTLFILSL